MRDEMRDEEEGREGWTKQKEKDSDGSWWCDRGTQHHILNSGVLSFELCLKTVAELEIVSIHQRTNTIVKAPLFMLCAETGAYPLGVGSSRSQRRPAVVPKLQHETTKQEQLQQYQQKHTTPIALLILAVVVAVALVVAATARSSKLQRTLMWRQQELGNQEKEIGAMIYQ